MLSCVIFFENRRVWSYMWSERLLVSVSSVFVCDSHEGRVKFDADSRHRWKSDVNVGVAMTWGIFLASYRNFGAL